MLKNFPIYPFYWVPDFVRSVGPLASTIFVDNSCLFDYSYRWGFIFKIAAYPRSSSVLTDFSASQAFFLKVDLGFVLLDVLEFHLTSKISR
jgi:hypothetical protein